MKKILYFVVGFSCLMYGQYIDPTFPGIRAQFEDEPMGKIKWYFQESSMSGLNTSYLGPNAVDEKKNEIAIAFSIWHQHISSNTYSDNIVFEEGNAGDFKILISFANYPNANLLGSTVCMDEDEIGSRARIEINKNSSITWYKSSYSSPRRYLQNTLVHEIGHALLGAFASTHHSSDSSSVMRAGFDSVDVVNNLPSYDANIAFQTYHWRKFQFFGEISTDWVLFADPRKIYVTEELELIAPYVTIPSDPFQQIIHGAIKQRSLWDENLLVGSVLSQGDAYKTVLKWTNNGSEYLSSQHQFTTVADNTINAEYGATYEFNFQSGQFVDGGGPSNYFEYSIGPDIVKKGNSTRYYGINQSINITPHPPAGYYFYQWNDGTSEIPKTIISNANKTIYAIYKAQLKSNNADNLSSNGPHKFIRTGDGNYHLVYNSGNKVWYESSSDNGATWDLKYSDTGGKPAIAAVNNSRVLFVYPYNTKYIKAVCYDNSTEEVLSAVTSLGRTYDAPGDVALAIASSGKMAVAFYNSTEDEIRAPGYYGLAGSIASNGTITWGSNPSYNYNFASSTASNALLEVRLEDTETLFHFAFDDDDGNGGREIYYGPLIWSNNTLQQYVYSPYINPISSASGYLNNYNPSIIPVANEGLRVNWIGDNGSGNAVSIFKDPSYWMHWTFGSNVTSTSINKASNGYVIGWSNGTNHQYANSSGLYTLGYIYSNGKYLQISNSDYMSTMRAMGYNLSNSPYLFNLSIPIGSYPSKKDWDQDGEIYGRGVVVSLKNYNDTLIEIDTSMINKPLYNHSKFSLLVDNIFVDGLQVKFDPLQENGTISDISAINSSLVTQSFPLYDHSNFSYDVVLQATNNMVSETMDIGKYIKFTIELIDTKTNQVIGVQKDVVYSRVGNADSEVNSYDIDCKGIEAKTVHLRIQFNTNESAQYALMEKVVRRSEILQKKSNERIKISYRGGTPITEYFLDQNFPNPFNPITTISYALPQDGMVTLKIYDALGREVSTLVNEFKMTGRYTASLDASRLSSGVYIYKLTSGKYKATRKMLLLK